MARLVLTQPGEDVTVGGDVSLFGTASGGEIITVLHGIVTLDPSFNLGGDTVRLPDDAQYFTVRQSGASVTIAGSGVSVVIPVGTAGISIAFNDVTRALLFDPVAGKVKLGDQPVTSTSTAVVPTGGLPTLVGTESADAINGTAGNDVIDGLGGPDRIDGGSGNDVIRGGSGDDELNGSFGNDELYGGPGADRITDNAGSANLLDGGTGNDTISMESYTVANHRVVGGDGDDLIILTLGLSGACTIDAGAGADRLVLTSSGVSFAITLGGGRDQIAFPAYALEDPGFGVLTIADFEPGALGDTIELNVALSTYLIGWSQSADPFSAGFLRLIDRTGEAVLQIDRDGAGAGTGFRDLIVFTGDTRASFGPANFEGYDPLGGAAAAAVTAAMVGEAAPMQPFLPAPDVAWLA